MLFYIDLTYCYLKYYVYKYLFKKNIYCINNCYKLCNFASLEC